MHRVPFPSVNAEQYEMHTLWFPLCAPQPPWRHVPSLSSQGDNSHNVTHRIGVIALWYALRMMSTGRVDVANNVENLVLEMLRALRNEVKSYSVKMDEQFESVRLRLSSNESHLVSLQREVVDLHADVVIVHSRMDKFEARLDRIERRLDLRDEAV